LGPYGEGFGGRFKTGGIRWRIRLGLAAAAFLVIAAIAKPWPGGNPAEPATSSPVAVSETASTSDIAAATPPRATSKATPGEDDVLSGLCQSHAGWLIVVDDMELGRVVRTWLVINAVSEGPGEAPVQSAIPVATLVSGDVRQLGFCQPDVSAGSSMPSWTGRLWWQAPGGSATARKLVGRLAAAAGSGGAVAEPPAGASAAWPSGLYLLEIDLTGSTTSAWLGVLIKPQPNG
jgi:hypothetical protein